MSSLVGMSSLVICVFAIAILLREYNIHPSIIHICLVLCRVIRICWSLSQLSEGERQGYTLDRSPVHHRADMTLKYANFKGNYDKPLGIILLPTPEFGHKFSWGHWMMCHD